MDDLWVFGYGSLMWRPGFRFAEVQRARVPGYGRSFCIYSVHHRGSEARPGLVLGLDRGGVCEGLAYRVARGDARRVMSYLREREQVNGVYREAHVAIELHGIDGLHCSPVVRNTGHDTARRETTGHETVVALAYLAERAHPSYAGHLPLSVQARIVRGARGNSGNNMDYVASTLAHLRELGIRDWELERLGVVAGVRLRNVYGDDEGERVGAGVVGARVLGASLLATRRPARVRRLRPLERRRFIHRKGMGA